MLVLRKCRLHSLLPALGRGAGESLLPGWGGVRARGDG